MKSQNALLPIGNTECIARLPIALRSRWITNLERFGNKGLWPLKAYKMHLKGVPLSTILQRFSRCKLATRDEIIAVVGNDARTQSPMEKWRRRFRVENVRPQQSAKCKVRDLPLFSRAYLERIKYKTDPIFKFTHLLRQRLRNVAKRGRGYSGDYVAWLGCTPEQFKFHIESQWQLGMNWGNLGIGAGKWSLDHRRPCASFDMTSESQRCACFYFTNIQPMWSNENAKKQAKWNGYNYHNYNKLKVLL